LLFYNAAWCEGRALHTAHAATAERAMQQCVTANSR